jgi:hypothetical protein
VTPDTRVIDRIAQVLASTVTREAAERKTWPATWHG